MTRSSSTPRARATIVLGALAALAGLAPALGPALELDRLHSWMAQPWRLLSAHLVHFGWGHLAWDLSALLLLGTFCERRRPRTTRSALALSALAIPAVFLIAEPNLDRYRGLSGLASALFALTLCLAWRDARPGPARFVIALAGLGFGAKLLAETLFAAPVFVADASFVPVASAHLTGALIGLSAGLSQKFKTLRGRPTPITRSGRVAVH